MRVTVVGGGVVGLSVAFELSSRGASVRVVDMRGVGQGATQASAGMLAPHIEGHHPALLRLGTCSLDLYDQFIARLGTASGVSVEYRRCGTLQVARGDEQSPLLHQAAALGAACVDHTWLDEGAVRRMEPALDRGQSWTGLLIPAHGYVRVPQLMTALRTASTVHNVAYETTAVGRLDADELGADVVVLAAGSWSGLMTQVPVRPIRGQIVELSFPEPPLSHIVWGSECYLVPWMDGSLLVGATAEDVGFDEHPDDGAAARLVSAAGRLVPSVRGATEYSSRVGLRPATPDELPIIGWSSTMPAVMYATGHYRNGILLAPLTAALVADLVLEGHEGSLLDLVRPARFSL